jgi:hypothetical protein
MESKESKTVIVESLKKSRARLVRLSSESVDVTMATVLASNRAITTLDLVAKEVRIACVTISLFQTSSIQC